jgi:predicted RNase H-like nuclease
MTGQELALDDVPQRVLGVDACQKGWVGLTNELPGYFGRTIEELVAAAAQDGELDVIAIDIPIGLPVSGARQADVLARALVGKRASSAFPTPVRSALAAASYGKATAISVQASGKGVSKQSYALRTKIFEVDGWARTTPQPPIEVHPEVCFATMARRPLKHPKSTWSGSEERRRILAGAGIVVPSEIGLAGEMAGTDDVLDAAAASWTALRSATVEVSYPAVPESFGDGHAAAIWA